MPQVIGCLEMVVCQQQCSQSMQVTNVFHASDEIFAEIERVELEVWEARR